MVEGILRHEAGEHYDVFSAGTHPAPVRTEAVALMREVGVDISSQRSKSVQEFEGQHSRLSATPTCCQASKMMMG